MKKEIRANFSITGILIFSILLISCRKNDRYPEVSTTEPTDVTSTTATLNGTVNANEVATIVHFEFGSDISYGQTVSPVQDSLNGNDPENISALVTDLSPNTTYHFRIMASSDRGVMEGGDMSFTTSPRLSTLQIGDISPDIAITDLNPDKVLISSNEQVEYTVDLDNDQLPDLKFTCFSSYIGGGMYMGNTELGVETLTSETFVLTDSVSPNVFSSGDTIHLGDKWKAGSLRLLKWGRSYPPSPQGGDSSWSGNWYNQANRYIGIKFKDRLGWVKLSTSIYQLAVQEYGLQK